jgi:hypothetical protein
MAPIECGGLVHPVKMAVYIGQVEFGRNGSEFFRVVPEQLVEVTRDNQFVTLRPPQSELLGEILYSRFSWMGRGDSARICCNPACLVEKCVLLETGGHGTR